MRSVFFGLGSNYDVGADPAVGLNRAGTVLAIYKKAVGYDFLYRLGKLDQATVAWAPDGIKFDSGSAPDCALNDGNVAVEMHRNEGGHTLYTQVGTVVPATNRVTWHGANKSGGGHTPGVALNNRNVVVSVHRTDHVLHTDRLYCRVGQVNGTKVDWESDEQYDSGAFPRIALNNSGQVVEVHQGGANEGIATELWIRVGRVEGKKIKLERAAHFADGNKPSVTLTDDGAIVVAWTNAGKLKQRVGRIDGAMVSWTDNITQFDDGIAPSLAAAGSMVLQVHQSETVKHGLFYSSSILTDRAIWMQERLKTLGARPLAGLVLPASHDASMYRGGPAESFARTQDLPIFDQLEYGIRYFDLRVRWTGKKFVMFHGPVDGPDLADILEGFKRYANFGHKEVAILKFSHFKDIDNTTYEKFTKQVNDAIGKWLVKSKVAGKRLAQMTLNEYVGSGTALLAVVDDDYAIAKPMAGFWIYRDADWADGDHGAGYDPAVGDLRVFDVYSNKISLDPMIEDQRKKFAEYNGTCARKPSVPCDMYLMSWTLTPPTDVWDVSKSANRCLGEQMTKIADPNSHKQIINMVYVDYVQYARVTDVVLFKNGTPFPSV